MSGWGIWKYWWRATMFEVSAAWWRSCRRPTGTVRGGGSCSAAAREAAAVARGWCHQGTGVAARSCCGHPSRWIASNGEGSGVASEEKHMLPTVATVNHCRQCRQAHEHFVSLLWWYQPQRCGFVCLPHRSLWLQRGRCDQDVAYKETVSSPVAPSRLCFGGIVDGGTTALWVVPGFPTWRGLALICLCAGSSETAECFDVKMMSKSMFVTFVKCIGISQPELPETCWCR